MPDPVTTGWLWALGALGAAALAIPLLRMLIAAALYLASVLTGRRALRNRAVRVLPRTAHLLGSLVVGAAAITAPAMASERTAPVGIDRDGGLTAVDPAVGPNTAVGADRQSPPPAAPTRQASVTTHADAALTLDRAIDVAARASVQPSARGLATSGSPMVGHASQPHAATRGATSHAPNRDPGESQRTTDRIYIVRVGDTLWDIASDHLPDARDAQVAETWKAIWRANRAVIGDNPGLIHPGQHLNLGGIA